MTAQTTIERRKARLIRHALEAAAGDFAGHDRARRLGTIYEVKLHGRSLQTLKAAFRSALNLCDPPRYLENFHESEIAAHPAFAAFRDRLNEQGMEIAPWRGHYLLMVLNKRITTGRDTPALRFGIVDWDGVKKPLEAYDHYKHGPKPVPRPLFY